MLRGLRPAGAVVGLFALFASCTIDQPISPSTLGRVSTARSSEVEAAAGPAVVISQIYGGGGNAGATLKNDFIELFNPGSSAVSVDGWSVQYASQNGTTWQVTTLAGSIAPGRYYLVQEAQGNGGTVDLPTPDRTGSILMSANNGKVVVASQTTALSGACPTGPVLVDRVGFGTTNCADWNTAVALTNTTAALRKNDGCMYTSNPASDFAVGAPNPRNSGAPPRPCGTVDVARITIDPTSASVIEGSTVLFTGHAFDALDHELAGVVFSWSSSNTGVATISGGGLAKGMAPGDVDITVNTANATIEREAVATLHVDESVLPDLPTTRFSELHYDNIGTDVGEAIEIEGPAGTNLTGWSVVLYNGDPMSRRAYDTRVLDQSVPDMCSGRGVLVVRYEQDGIQNGSPDGFALVDAGGHVVEFLSYEGVMTAVDGPAAGMESTDIGVLEASAPHFQTLQRRASGRWNALAPSTLGRCFGADPVTPVNQVSFSGRLKTDAPLPVGFEDQLFGSLRDPANDTVHTSFVWHALNPEVATIDVDGVMHAYGPGSATFRATADIDGTTATFTLPMIVATASRTAHYGNNAEFGEPTDADASDDYIIHRTEYTSSFNKNRNIPNWVSYDLESTHIQSGQDRCDCFTYDPLLPFTRYTTADYTGAGSPDAKPFRIDRGHLARSFDRTSGSLDNARTFYFSNIIPQAADNNQGPWASLENYLGGLAQDETHEVYVIAGASGSQGTVKNEGLITIPQSTWKVAVIMPRDEGLADVQSYRDVAVIAVILPNVAGLRNVPWENYKTTVNAVEQLSGYDILSLLPKKIQTVVEAGMQDEMAMVDDLVVAKKLSPGIGNSLTSKLEAAAASLDRGQNATAINQLEAFLNELDAIERSRRLSAGDAGTLRSAIQALIASIAP